MIFVPLPFVVTLLLVIVLIQMKRRQDLWRGQNRFFTLLIAAYALQSVLIGIRWGYDITAIMPFQAVLATLIASLCWVSFSGLVLQQTQTSPYWNALHLLPALLVMGLLIFWREPVGPVIVVTFLGYGMALLWIARDGPDALVLSSLDGVILSYRSLMITAVALIASALSDVIINLDLTWFGGTHSPLIIAFGNVLALLILGGAASVASSGHEGIDPAGEPVTTPAEVTGEDAAIAARVDELMQTRRLFQDTELNLGRLARKLNVPARRVSVAINKIHRMSVSQYVNDYRVREACRLLKGSDEPVTRIMFDAGFLTKSNFNREFLRVTGQNPTAWRAQPEG